MGFAESEFLKYLRRHMDLLEQIKINEMLFHLAGVLTPATVESLQRSVINNGNSNTLLDFVSDLSKRDNWVNNLISALEQCGLTDLADKFQRTYDLYQPQRRNTEPESPQSLPPTTFNQQPPLCQPDGFKRTSSLPLQLPSLDPQRDQRFSQIQPDQETTQRPPSQNNSGSPSLPQPTQPSIPPPQSSIPVNIQLDSKTSKDKTSMLPIPETTPFHAALPADRDEVVSVAAKSLEPRPSTEGSHSVRKDVGVEHQRREQPVYGQEAKPPEPRPSAIGSHSVREDVRDGPQRREQSVNGEAAKPPEPHPSAARKDVGDGPQRREQPVYGQAAKPPEPRPSAIGSHSVREDVRDGPQHREQSVHGEAAKPPEPRPSAIGSHSVREDVRDGPQHREQSVHEEAARPPEPRPPAARKDFGDGPQRREQSGYGQATKPPEPRPSAAGSHSVREDVGRDGPQHREQSAYRGVVPFCVPEDSDVEETAFSKPGILDSTCRFAREDSELSEIPEFQISDDEEVNESRRVSDQARSSPTSPQSNTRMSSTAVTQPKMPPTSTPNNQRTWQHSGRSPEENDYSFGNVTHPGTYSAGHNRPADVSLSNQPQENSFALSNDYRYYTGHHKEEAEADLNEGNHAMPRHRQLNVQDTHELNDKKKCQNNSETETKKSLEKTVIMTLGVAVVCLSLFLLWKKQRA
ncbi:mitochondrial antiviral-signaling protein isoform X2 [Mixophyes fleayi]|uniref:mitochondrial antiviral-signaling protein isoform X2 n=1 Tax=Mixophyes fleayi TaxID=3061075 RepID=UPI003F4DCDCF